MPQHLTQFEIVGNVWSVEYPTEKVCALTIQTITTWNENNTECFYTVKLFGGLIDKAREQCMPGDPVRVTGRLKSREYNDKHYPEFLASNLFVTERKVEPKPQPEQKQQTSEEEDLPF